MKILYSLQVCALLSLSVNAYAQLDPTHLYKIIDPASGQALEIGGGGDLSADGTSDDFTIKANLWGYWGGANQQWSFKPITSANGTAGYQIINKNSSKALCVPQVNGPTGDQWIWQSQCGNSYPRRIVSQQTAQNGNDLQVWYVQAQPQGGNLYNLVSAAYPKPIAGNAAGGTGGNTHEAKCSNLTVYLDKDGPGVQPWQVIDLGLNPSNSLTAGNFQIINNYTGKALSSPPDGSSTNVGQVTAWGLAVQQWSFSESNAPGYYLIKNRSTGRVLEIGGGGNLQQPGMQANIWDNWNGPNQQWALVEPGSLQPLSLVQATDGRSFQIINRNSGYVLEIGDAPHLSPGDGARANQWYNFNNPWQQWHAQFHSYARSAAAPSTVTAIEQGKSKVELYPNPVHDVLSFTSTSIFDPATIKVTDIRGAAVPAYYHNGRIDVSALSIGLYIVTVSDGSQTYHCKFAKE